MEKSIELLIKSLLDPKKPGTVEKLEPGQVDVDGAAWVRDGVIFVRDPKGCGRPAVIIPAPEVQLFVNGNEVSGPTEVRASDDIAVVPRTRELPGRLGVKVAPDRLTAVLRGNTHAPGAARRNVRSEVHGDQALGRATKRGLLDGGGRRAAEATGRRVPGNALAQGKRVGSQ